MQIDLRPWAKRNFLHLRSGEAAVRPGLRQVYTAESGRTIVGGKTLRNPRTGEVFHYVFDVDSTSKVSCIVRIYDENWTERTRYFTYSLREPRAISVSVVNEQVLITSPAFPTLWGWVGGGLVRAAKKASINPATTAINVPRGISVSWQGRAVVADGQYLYFSDALEPRTFVPANLVQMEATVYGLHKGSNGQLVVATEAGIQTLSEEAAAAGQVVLGIFSEPDEEPVRDFNTTAVVRGRVYALTEKGFRSAVPPEPREMLLDEPVVPRIIYPRKAEEDYRDGRIIEGLLGPYVASADELYVFDEANVTGSWWSAPSESSFKAVASLFDADMREVLLTSAGAFKVMGNFDGDEALTSEGGTAVRGGYVGKASIPAGLSTVARRIHWGSDTGGNVYHSVREDGGSGTVTQAGLVVGNFSWSGGGTFEDPEMGSVRTDYGDRSDDFGMELLAENPLSRIADDARLEDEGPGKDRPG